jgi:uncharacterized damage-inducible protein DinB
MEVTDVRQFLSYWENIRSRTMRVIRCIPREQIEWAYASGKFTLGDLVRHLAAIERYMYAETVAGRPSAYAGCGPDLASGYEEVTALIERLHRESVEIFARLTPSDLQKKCLTPDGSQITTWKWLRAMVEHECHHRGQIYLYLAMLGVAAPPLFGLTSEQVRERSARIRVQSAS